MTGREKIQALIERLRNGAERKDHVAQRLLELSIEDDHYADALESIIGRFSDAQLDEIAHDLKPGEDAAS